MKTFRINKHIEVVCESQSTRYGFRHLAHLIYDGKEVDGAKICYYNRTWESYEFESVLERLLDITKALSEKERKLFDKFIKDGGRVKDDCAGLKAIAGIASLGNIFGKTTKDKNDWKERMIKAGLEGKGLIMPEDWETLSEEEKETRLNGAISALK